MLSDRLGTEEYLRLHRISVVVTKHDRDADSRDDVLEFQGNSCRRSEFTFCAITLVVQRG